MASVRTVLGDVAARTIGRTNYHEHFFQSSPLLPGDDLDDEEASSAEAVLLRDSGFDAVVDATPLGLGRRPAALARISAQTGLRIVMTTGTHRVEHYGAGHPLLDRSVDSLTLQFERELVHGADDPDGDPVPAGVLKAGIGYWRINAFERRVLEAVAAAQCATGAPVMVHLEHGSAAHEVLDLLAGFGVDEQRVALAHVDRNPDPDLLGELAARGAYLGVDGMGRHREWPDAMLVDLVETLVAHGYADRILLGGDVARRSRYVAYGGMPGLAYLGRRFLPRLESRLGRVTVDRILRDSPQRWLSWTDA